MNIDVVFKEGQRCPRCSKPFSDLEVLPGEPVIIKAIPREQKYRYDWFPSFVCSRCGEEYYLTSDMHVDPNLPERPEPPKIEPITKTEMLKGTVMAFIFSAPFVLATFAYVWVLLSLFGVNRLLDITSIGGGIIALILGWRACLGATLWLLQFLNRLVTRIRQTSTEHH